MSFTSIFFLVFIGIIFIFYNIFPLNKRWLVLLTGSYIFYGIADVRFIVFILFTTFSSYFTALQIEKHTREYNSKISSIAKEQKALLKAEAKKVKKAVMLKGIALNLTMLIVVKYTNDFIYNINFIGNHFHFDFVLNPISILVPLGISYYVFQSIGYMVDVYRGKYPADKNFLRYALFVSFFPQLIQGPISRYDELALQLYEGHSFHSERIQKATLLILWGYTKKLIIADRLGIMVNTIFNNYPQYMGGYAILAGVGYSLQVYTDFSGGIDVARGVAELFGIVLPENFQQPFFAASLQDYWRRWHISLNNWLRDYVFYPISLSRAFVNLGKHCRRIFGLRFGKNLAIYIATFVVRLIMAIWHGASWKYVFQGFFHGFLITAGIQLKPELELLTKKLKINTSCFSWRLFQILRTFTLVTIARIIVRASSVSDAWKMIKSIIAVKNPWIWFDGSLYGLGLSRADILVLLLFLLLLFLVSFMKEKQIAVREAILSQNMVFRWIIYYILIFSIIILGIYGPGYDASAFIYQQF